MVDITRERWFNWICVVMAIVGIGVVLWEYRQALVDLIVFAVCIWLLWRAVLRLT